MKYTTDSEQLKETRGCLAMSVFLTTNCFVSHANLCHDSICLSAMYSLYMLYIHIYITYIYTHTHTHTHKYTC